MLQITRSVVEVLDAGTKFPASWRDLPQVTGYYESLVPGLAKLTVEIAELVESGRLGLIGASQDEIRATVVEELEGRQVALNPALIEAIVQIVMFVIQLLQNRKRD